MEILLLLLLLAVFLLPSFLMMRSQRKRQAEIQTLQNAITVGDRIVTASGLHGTIAAVRETEIDLELAPGILVTMEKMAVVRHAEPNTPGLGGTGADQIGYPGSGSAAPEQGPNSQFPYGTDPSTGGDDTPGGRDDLGHPENRP